MENILTIFIQIKSKYLNNILPIIYTLCAIIHTIFEQNWHNSFYTIHNPIFKQYLDNIWPLILQFILYVSLLVKKINIWTSVQNLVDFWTIFVHYIENIGTIFEYCYLLKKDVFIF